MFFFGFRYLAFNNEIFSITFVLSTNPTPSFTIFSITFIVCSNFQKNRFEIYSKYCNNQPRSSARISSLTKEKKYELFFEVCFLILILL